MTNINRKINFYTQAQRFAARALFIVGLLVNCNPQRALASDISLPRMITIWAAVWAMFSGREVSPLQILANNSSFSPSCEEYLSQEDHQYLRGFMTLVANSEEPCLCIDLEEYGSDHLIRILIRQDMDHLLNQVCKKDHSSSEPVVFLYEPPTAGRPNIYRITEDHFWKSLRFPSAECPDAQDTFSCPPQTQHQRALA